MIPWTEILLRLALAAFFGGIIGLERERKDWAAGLRTHMMVSVGAALTMMVSAYGFADVLGQPNVVLDPSRVAAQVISGIGFIGAGTILFLKEGVIRGLTTAAGLWTVAAIGLATGGGMYFAAFIATSIAIIILWLLQPVEKKFLSRFEQKTIRIITFERSKSIEVADKLFQNPSLNITTCNIEQTDSFFIITVRFRSMDKAVVGKLIGEIQTDTGVKEVSWNA
ncbi:MgtC/SapB family protein [Chitinophaga arvensicola]|uniref:Putative Mg2+ transporter-C (MgtC) family protein n=1 Tax=Chitinophaga arvensicola TaxID=29529 RepID=A0A1I0RLU0_9BACT|nr:MgtC/SapB family protein [Chitinophaga arvensicola]SEW42131.1 putative Mg2+ transporter-C (MgtC) family protein [Chitinophaga arvensicola]